MIKYYTHQTPPPVLAEPKSSLPDECRQSDFISLPMLLQRFIASGARYTEYMGASAEENDGSKADELLVASGARHTEYMGARSLSAEEKEALFDGVTVDELLEDDISVQKSFADGVLNRVIKQQGSSKEPTQPVKQDEPEKKPETAENA